MYSAIKKRYQQLSKTNLISVCSSKAWVRRRFRNRGGAVESCSGICNPIDCRTALYVFAVKLHSRSLG